MNTTRGVDVSTYQGTQDWAAHKRNGVTFAFAKASEGQTSRDSRFATHITGIKQAGLIPGAYHFAWPNQDVAREAANYIAAVRDHAGPGFLHWLDLERYSDGRNYAGRTSTQIREWATKWIALVTEAFPAQRVGIYTSADDLASGRVPAGVPLWYPAYPGSSVDTYAEAEARPRPAPSGRAPLIWQFTSVPASGPRMDLNIAYLSPADLHAWANPQENDMPLNTDDLEKIRKAVWESDKVAAPADAPDVKTNPTWQAQSYLKDTNARVRTLQATVAALSATNGKLVDTVAQLAAGIGDLDPATIVTELKQAIESIDIHIDATP